MYMRTHMSVGAHVCMYSETIQAPSLSFGFSTSDSLSWAPRGCHHHRHPHHHCDQDRDSQQILHHKMHDQFRTMTTMSFCSYL